MRLGILICGLMLIPAFAVVLEWRYQWQQKPALENEAREMFDLAGLPNVSLELDHFRVLLKGICLDQEGRDRAEVLTRRLAAPLQFDAESNQVRIPAKVTARFEGEHLHLAGWLNDEAGRKELAQLAKQFRPELKIHAEEIVLTPYAVLGPDTKIDQIDTHAAFAGFLETIRPTTYFSVTPENGFLRVRGCLPNERQRIAAIDAIQSSAWQWPVEASKLVANPHAPATLFTQGEALANFLRAYYDSSAPGEFAIDARNGPKLKAVVTPAMEARLRTLLLPLSGALRAQPEFTIVPTEVHMPGYKVTSESVPEVLERLPDLLRLLNVHFEKGSAKLEPAEQERLGALAFVLRQAGWQARFLVAGYEEPGGEAGGGSGRLKAARAETVVNRLVALGVARDVLLPQGFDAPRPPGVITEELRRESRRAELLLK